MSVGRAAGRERHDDADRLRRVRLRRYADGECRGQYRETQARQPALHHCLHLADSVGWDYRCLQETVMRCLIHLGARRLMIRAYLASSRAIICANCSGVSGAGSAPSAISFARTSGVVSICFVTSAFHFAMMAGGVPAGAKRPYHVEMSKPGRPASRLSAIPAPVRSFRRGHRQRFQLACLDLRHGVGEVVEHELRVAGEQRLRRGRPALERNVHGVGSRLHLVELTRQVSGTAVAARGEVRAGRVGFRRTQ